MLKNHLLLEDLVYFGGAGLAESLELVDEKPRTRRVSVPVSAGADHYDRVKDAIGIE